MTRLQLKQFFLWPIGGKFSFSPFMNQVLTFRKIEARKTVLPFGSPLVRSLTIHISSMAPNLLKASRKSSSVTDFPQTMKRRELGGSSCLLSFKAFSASKELCCESLGWRSADVFDFRSAILHPFTFYWRHRRRESSAASATGAQCRSAKPRY